MIIVNDAKNMHKTFPLIFQNGRFIGGYSELDVLLQQVIQL